MIVVEHAIWSGYVQQKILFNGLENKPLPDSRERRTDEQSELHKTCGLTFHRSGSPQDLWKLSPFPSLSLHPFLSTSLPHPSYLSRSLSICIYIVYSSIPPATTYSEQVFVNTTGFAEVQLPLRRSHGDLDSCLGVGDGR